MCPNVMPNNGSQTARVSEREKLGVNSSSISSDWIPAHNFTVKESPAAPHIMYPIHVYRITHRQNSPAIQRRQIRQPSPRAFLKSGEDIPTYKEAQKGENVRRKIHFSLSRKVGFGLLRASLRLEGKASAFRFLPYNLWKVVLVSLRKSHPLSLLMGKKPAKPHKEKMPACPEQYFSGIGETASVECGFVLAGSSTHPTRGSTKSITDKKGRERPRVTFRAAGRTKRGGRSRPFAVLAHVRICVFGPHISRSQCELGAS